MTTMRAAWYEAKGEARAVLRVGELERPTLGAGEVLVRVHASGLNPSDIKGRSGFGGAEMAFPRVVPHQDGAGVIQAVGEGVDASRIGQRVWLYMAQWRRPFGTAAEWVTLPAERAVPLPESVSFEAGASLGVPAITAHRLVSCLGGVRGQRVLISGLGAVGYYAVQLALRLGAAEVVATVRRPLDAEAALAAGATHVRSHGEPLPDSSYDRVIEVNLGANLVRDLSSVKPGGVICSYASDADWTPELPLLTAMAKNVVLAPVLVYTLDAEALGAAVQTIGGFLRDGMRHRTAAVLPLEAIALAHERQEAGGVGGKIVISLD
jgi:NADPH:quinone reductase